MPYLFSSAAARAARAESLASLAQSSHTLLNATERLISLSSDFGRQLFASGSAWQLPATPKAAVAQQGETIGTLRRQLPTLIGGSVQIASDTQEALAHTFQAHVDCTRQLLLDSFGSAQSAAPWEIHPWLRTLQHAIDSSSLTAVQLAQSSVRQVEQAEQQVAEVVTAAASRSRRNQATSNA